MIESNLHKLSDEHLVGLYQSGNELAFNELTVRFNGFIKYKTSSFLIPGLDSDDLTQEATLSLMNAALTYKEIKNSSFKTYASICITRHMISTLKVASRKKHTPLNESLPLNGDDEFLVKALSDNNPLSIIINAEDSEKLRRDIDNKLSEFEYTVLFLRMQGRSYLDIADELFVEKKSVDNAIQRIRKKLKENDK